MFLAQNGVRVEDGQLKEADNMEASMDFFLNEKNNNEKGKELIEKINNTREKLVALLDEKDKASFKSDLKTEEPLPDKEGTKLSWLEETFEKLPLAATFANLTKYQNDAKKTESDVIASLASNVYIRDHKVTNVEANIVAPFSSISAGQTFTANVFLSGYNKNENYQMTMNGVPLDVKDGKGTYKVTPNAEGIYKYEAKIMVPDPETGVLVPYTSSGEYQVFNPHASVSVANMKVLYADIDNPVDITVPGYRPDQVTASITNGRMTGANGKYQITTSMSNNREVKVRVNARTDDGTTRSFEETFYIRPLPPLEFRVNNKTGGVITKEEAARWSFLSASYGPYFPLNVGTFKVTRYSYAIKSANQVVGSEPSNTIKRDLGAGIAAAKKGDLIILYNIQAVGPNGATIAGNDLVFTLK
jgi:gliding motility-associated protein GldM